MKQNSSKKVYSAASWSFLNTFVGQLGSFAVSMVLARLLEPAKFGLLGMALTFSWIFENIVDMGLGDAVVQSPEINNRQLSTIFYLNIVIGILFTVIMVLCAPLIAWFFRMPELKLIVMVMSCSFIVKAFNVVPSALLRREINFRVPFFIQCASMFFSGSLGIVLAYRGWGIWSLVWMTIVSWWVGVIVLWIFSSWRPEKVFSFAEIRQLWSFGYKQGVNVLLESLFSKIDPLVIGRYFQPTELGLFSRAQSLNRLSVQYSFNFISPILFPSMSSLKGDIDKLRSNVRGLLILTAFSTFFFSGLTYLTSDELILLFYGNNWQGAVPLFKCLALFSFTLTLPTIMSNAILSIGRSDLCLKVEVVKKVFLIAAIFIGIRISIQGYILAVGMAAALSMLLSIYILKLIRLKFGEVVSLIGVYLLEGLGLAFSLNLLFSYLSFGNLFGELCVKASVFSFCYLGINFLLHSAGWNYLISLLHKLLRYGKSRLAQCDGEAIS